MIRPLARPVGTIGSRATTRVVLETEAPRESAAFYSALMGWEIRRAGDGSDTAFGPDGTEIALFSERPGPSQWVPYFDVADLPRAIEQSVRAGADVVETAPGEARVANAWGGTFGIRAARSLPTPPLPDAIGMVDVGVEHAAAPTTFYERLFEWETAVVGRGYRVFLDAGEPVAGLWSSEGEIGERIWSTSRVGWTVYLSVADCDAAVALAAELGAQIRVPTQSDSPTGPFAFLRDPVGAFFGVSPRPQLQDLLDVPHGSSSSVHQVAR